MFKFNKTYLVITIIIFLIEVLIAVFVRDKFIRPYIGDFLVVILIYSFFRSFLKIKPFILAVCVSLFAYIIETLQYFNIVDLLGLQNNKTASVILGNSFGWEDIGIYTLGVILILLIDSYTLKIKSK